MASGRRPEPVPTAAEGPLATARLHEREARAAAERVRSAVARAREVGATWKHVGDALGISPQGAQQRYGRPASE
jgi:hypothetical protein